MLKGFWEKKDYTNFNNCLINLITVHLHHLIFNAGHGLYEGESVTGNQFEINLDISFEQEGGVKNIKDTIDYGKVYQMVKMQMNKPVGLLEALSLQIIDAIHDSDTRIKKIKITIFKNHPPLPKFEGRVGVTLEKTF